MIALFLTSFALADSYAYEFGGIDDYTQDDAAANCFDVRGDFDITSVGVYIKKASASGTGFSFALWRDTGTGADFELVRTASASQTSSTATWVDKIVSWPVTGGQKWCIGVYSTSNLDVAIGDDHIDAPEWGANLGSAFATGGDLPDRLDARPSGDPEVKIRLTVQADDVDGDSVDAVSDCDDSDPDVYPGADEVWYDGVDGDCNGSDDYDQDGDGALALEGGGTDCDDTDPSVKRGADDAWYDGVDSDCDGASDYDKDGDGYDSDAHGGDDCDDSDPQISPGVEESWYDGVDQDCSGGSDYDRDGDGHESMDAGGDDCADANPNRVDCAHGDGGGAAEEDTSDDGGGCLCLGGSSAFVLLPTLSLFTARRRRTSERRG